MTDVEIHNSLNAQEKKKEMVDILVGIRLRMQSDGITTEKSEICVRSVRKSMKIENKGKYVRSGRKWSMKERFLSWKRKLRN